MENSIAKTKVELSKNENRTTIWYRNSTSGCISKGNENRISKRYLYSHVNCRIIHKTKIWKQPKCPSTDEWTKKMCLIYVYMCVCVCVCVCVVQPWERRNPAIGSNMDVPLYLEGINAKWDKSDRERQMLYDIIYMWNLKKANS